MATAALRFEQNSTVGTAGRAFVGAVADVHGGEVTLTSQGDNTGIDFWEFELLDVPNESALAEEVLNSGPNEAFFSPDVKGCYSVKVTISGPGIDPITDIRDFIIPEHTGDVIPALGSNASTHNYGGQTKGTKPGLNAMLRRMFLNLLGKTAIVLSSSAGPRAVTDEEAMRGTIKVTGGSTDAGQYLVFPLTAEYVGRKWLVLTDGVTAIPKFQDTDGVLLNSSKAFIFVCTDVDAYEVYSIGSPSFGGPPP